MASLVTAAACNCFTPVEEVHGDGGVGGGAGGGTGGGSVSSGECDSAAECAAKARPATSLCPRANLDGGFSCIDHACVFECEPGRSCLSGVGDAGCLDCGAERSCAPSPMGCGGTRAAGVESDNGCPGNLMTLMLTPLTNACGSSIADATGRVVGKVYRLADGTFLAFVPELGGTCVGIDLGTQVERWVLSCPKCQLGLQL